MLSDELLEGVNFLEAHKDDLINLYCEKLKEYYDPDMALRAAQGSYYGVISRLKGTPLQMDKMQKPLEETKRSGLNANTMIESAKALLICFKQYLAGFAPEQLKPNIKHALEQQVEMIVKRNISNIQMAELKDTMNELNKLQGH
jgi:hypothetical protein